MDKIRCQSCGMPLGEGFFGTNADGSQNQEYCTFCYQHGTFTEPKQTLEKMIAISIHQMITEQHIPEEKAKELAQGVIPHLKRWSDTQSST